MTRILLLLALLAPLATAQLVPDLGEPQEQEPIPGEEPAAEETPLPAQPIESSESGFDWGSGLALGIGAGTLGLAALAGLAYYLGVGGLRHVDKHNVLEHPMRKSLMEVVESSPGVHLRELAQRHETAVTNTQWHLRKLEMAGLVKTEKVQGRRLYYPTRGGVQVKEQAIQNAAMQNPNAQKIMDYLQAHPGTNQRGLAEALSMNPGTVRWHLRKMESANMVNCVQDGTQSCYFPVNTGMPAAFQSNAGVQVQD